MTDLKWSFNDTHIGQIDEGGIALVTRIFPRPAGLLNGGWYETAGHLCRQLNALFPPLPPIALVSRELLEDCRKKLRLYYDETHGKYLGGVPYNTIEAGLQAALREKP